MDDPLGFVFPGAESIELEMTTLMTDIETADGLYREFPAFTDWTGLSEADEELWALFLSRLGASRAKASPADFHRAVEVAMRTAAIDTGAIEGLYSVDRGFTMAVALQSLAWQLLLDERGPGVRRLFEAQLAAYELVLDAATNALPIAEAWIRALHVEICAAQATYPVLTPQGWQDHELRKGEYKTRPNHVRLATGGILSFAPVERVREEMHRLVTEIRTDAFQQAHPALQASYAHYALVNIHPFADGNGRVARALASAFFYRAASIPLVVFADHRRLYLETLRAADEGNASPMIAFIRDRGLDTMLRVTESLSAAAGPQPDEVAESLAGRPISDRDVVALRLQAAIYEEMANRLRTLSLPPTVIAGLEMEKQYGWSEVDGWRVPDSCVLLDLRRVGSPSRQVVERFHALVSVDPAAMFALRVATSGSDDAPEVRLADATPELTERLRDRVRMWVDRQLARLLAELRAA
jgi:Fic family protein